MEDLSTKASCTSAFAALRDSIRDSVSVAMRGRELSWFLIVGCFTTLIDFLTYLGLIWICGAHIDIAKGAGFILGSALSYFANRFGTFSSTAHQPGSLLRFGLLYTATLGTNLIVNAAVWKLLRETRTAMAGTASSSHDSRFVVPHVIELEFLIFKIDHDLPHSVMTR